MSPNDGEVRSFLRKLEAKAKGARAVGSHRDRFYASEWNQGFPGGEGGFRAGQVDRLTEGWNPGNVGPNQAHHRGGAVMRQRARDLLLNNPYAVGAVDAYVANVIQQGITPKPKFADRESRQKWIKAWNRWGGLTPLSGKECDITGQDTIYELQALWLTEIIVGGGCLVNYVELPRKGRSIPLALQLIPEERFAEDILQSSGNIKTANPVINGVEIEMSTGRAVAYWIRQATSIGDAVATDYTPVRLPRETCEYTFWRKRVGQYRGHTWLHAAIAWLASLGFYVDQEMIASDAKSRFGVLIKTSSDAQSGFEWNDLNGPEAECQSGTTDIYGNPLTNLQPGMIARLSPGDEVVGVGPNVPGSDSKAWIQLIIRSIAVATGISYEELARDFSQGSFSSVRQSANADRIRFRRMSKFVDNHFNNPTWPRFADAEVRESRDGFPTPQDYIDNRDEWLDVDWEGPSWESVNPSDDAKADDIRIANLTKTRAACIPGDIDDHFDELEREAETIREKKLLPDPTAQDAGSTDGQLSSLDSKAKKP
jgi:lambda family phage portal protein